MRRHHSNKVKSVATVRCPFRQQGAVSLHQHYVAEETAYQEDISSQLFENSWQKFACQALSCPGWSCLANEQHCLPSYAGVAATTLGAQVTPIAFTGTTPWLMSECVSSSEERMMCH